LIRREKDASNQREGISKSLATYKGKKNSSSNGITRISGEPVCGVDARRRVCRTKFLA
jgi:hypothetical protein